MNLTKHKQQVLDEFRKTFGVNIYIESGMPVGKKLEKFLDQIITQTWEKAQKEKEDQLCRNALMEGGPDYMSSELMKKSDELMKIPDDLSK